MTSDEVMPKCSQRADGPTCSATAVVKAMTSCWVTCSISSMRAMSNPPLSRMSRAASVGTLPARAIATRAATSTCSQVWYFRWSLQMRPISGFVYRGIMSAERKPFLWKLEAVHGAEHGGRERTVEQIAGHALDVSRADALHAFERFVEAEL